MKLRIKTTLLTTRILGWAQVIGGVYGLGVVSWLLLKLGEINGAILFMVLFGYSLFAFSIVSGSKLLYRNSLKLGLILSMINQALQIIQFKILGYSLIYTSGTELSIGFKEGFNFNFGVVSSKFNMAINSDNTDFIFMINIFAILLIIILVDIWIEVYSSEKIIELNEHRN